jgi:hypothetical protein
MKEDVQIVMFVAAASPEVQAVCERRVECNRRRSAARFWLFAMP